jgi:beta-1,4-mannooligosaccharide/beta-1,4-mannosyl-N-acetylglucosamine phosphorylase
MICPDRPYEQVGFAPNVIFPTGALLDEKEDRLLLFSGGADEVIALSVLSIDDLLTHLGVHKTP